MPIVSATRHPTRGFSSVRGSNSSHFSPLGGIRRIIEWIGGLRGKTSDCWRRFSQTTNQSSSSQPRSDHRVISPVSPTPVPEDGFSDPLKALENADHTKENDILENRGSSNMGDLPLSVNKGFEAWSQLSKELGREEDPYLAICKLLEYSQSLPENRAYAQQCAKKFLQLTETLSEKEKSTMEAFYSSMINESEMEQIQKWLELFQRARILKEGGVENPLTAAASPRYQMLRELFPEKSDAQIEKLYQDTQQGDSIENLLALTLLLEGGWTEETLREATIRLDSTPFKVKETIGEVDLPMNRLNIPNRKELVLKFRGSNFILYRDLDHLYRKHVGGRTANLESGFERALAKGDEAEIEKHVEEKRDVKALMKAQKELSKRESPPVLGVEVIIAAKHFKDENLADYRSL